MRGAALGQAGALSGAYNTGMQNRLSLGTTLLGRSPLQSAGQNVAGSMQGMANLYGNQANLYGNAAQQGGQAVQGAIRGLGYGYGMNSPGYGTDVQNNPYAISLANMQSEQLNPITPRQQPEFDYTQQPSMPGY